MADDNSFLEKKKPHKKRHAGVKADKKKAKNLPANKTKNVKAFAITNARSAETRFRRKEDLLTKKHHVPVVDKTPEEPPPVLIAVVGPPKVGKSTLISNLIKNFTKTNVSNIKGPITLVTSKKRRITLIECNNDINSMIDIAKCADLVLLMVDASFGFEMEIFEFLNICQVHGMPKIMGILTHLDTIKSAKAVKMQKKTLKHRFWTEVYDGAKLFYLSGLIHGEYLRNEIKNLGRFISVMKFRPLAWRGAHSYVLADRMEDITNSEQIRLNAKCDREIVLYGYVRGVPLKQEDMIHIAGLGDIRIDELGALSDPCPLPSTEKKRNLLEKERLLYAPMSGVGGIVYDKDAVYIELHGSHSHKSNSNNTEQQQLVESVIRKKETLDVQLDNQEFRLFSDGDVIKSKEFKIDEYENDDSSTNGDSCQDSGLEESEDDTSEPISKWKTCQEPAEEQSDINKDDDCDVADFNEEIKAQKLSLGFLSSDEDEADALTTSVAWKEGLVTKARNAYLLRQATSKNLMKIVYGVFNKAKYIQNESQSSKVDTEDEDNENEDLLGGLFRNVAQRQTEMLRKKTIQDIDEGCFFEEYGSGVRDWTLDDNKKLIKNCFVTGKWKASEDAEELLKLDDMSDDNSEIFGDFEDLETGEKHASRTATAATDTNMKENNETNQSENILKRKISRIEEKNMSRAELMAKKIKLKAKFDSEYDNPEKDEQYITGDQQYYEKLKAEALRQTELNKQEFSNLDEDIRLNVEGFRAGLYVRMNFKNIPCEFVQHFDPTFPILIGGLNMSEENIGYVSCKLKKHRWYKKILKSGDPLIVSLGWRRFQTVPIFAKIEDDLKYRYLKYTPNHVTCSMTFWGPITPQHTGLLAIQSIAYDRQQTKRIGFRVAATGAVTESDKSAQIMKKLKLIGTPSKIYKKTAFIQGMFNSTLEVAKFEGAKIKTVSGIRGQIKKAVPPDGNFRATFEDRIVLSDIVFCRTWFKVTVPNFYAPVTNLLLPPEKRVKWIGMRTLGELKHEKNIQFNPNEDSSYKPIVREELQFKPLVIPKSLQKALPYKDKPKQGPLKSKKSFENERIAVVHSPHEQKVAKMMKMIKTNFDVKEENRKLQNKQKAEKNRKQKINDDFRRLQRQKELKKKVFKAISKLEGKHQSKIDK